MAATSIRYFLLAVTAGEVQDTAGLATLVVSALTFSQLFLGAALGQVTESARA